MSLDEKKGEKIKVNGEKSSHSTEMMEFRNGCVCHEMSLHWENTP